MHNVECKYELRDPGLARGLARAAGAVSVGVFTQTDTYFRVTSGRLKRRQTDDYPPEYIVYHRPDRLHAKISRFELLAEDQFRERYGLQPLPVWLEVVKTREILLLGNARIHLDDVRSLGRFLEIECLVSPSANVAVCRGVLAELLARFAPALGEPIDGSYADLLARHQPDPPANA